MFPTGSTDFSLDSTSGVLAVSTASSFSVAKTYTLTIMASDYYSTAGTTTVTVTAASVCSAAAHLTVAMATLSLSLLTTFLQ